MVLMSLALVRVAGHVVARKSDARATLIGVVSMADTTTDTKVDAVAAFTELPLATRTRLAATTLEDLARRMGADTFVGTPSGLRNIADEIDVEDAEFAERRELRDTIRAAVGHLIMGDPFDAATENAARYILNRGYRKVQQ